MFLSEQNETVTLLNNSAKQLGYRRHPCLKTALYFFLVLFLVFLLVVNQPRNSEIVLVPPPSNYSIQPPQIITRDSCQLKVIDPWDPTIQKFMIDVDPTKNCDRNWTPYTELKYGKWRVLKEKEGRECKARCFTMIDFNQTLNKTDWFPPGPTDCEFLEAVCWEDNKEVYGYIHTQIIPKIKKKLEVKPSNQPDVYVFMIDSLSSGAAHRSIPKSIELLKTEFKAVHFPYMSQIGQRSKPNAMALWFGKQIEDGVKVDGKRVNVDWTENEYCERYLDDEPNLFSDFGKEGYMTLHSEDWSAQMVNTYPNCKGFKNPYSNHSFYPFNRPKFAWHWNVHVQHNYLAGAQRLDEPLKKFFVDNFDKFDNSFIILMADHGIRFGPHELYETDIGKQERRNPLLYISVPKKYRTNGILEVMKENAERLQTHYDTRATLLDIAKYQPSTNFNDRTFFQIPNEKGQSLIRKQPKTPRNCKTLPIPQQYCLCQSKETDMIEDIELSQRLARELINHVHDKLEVLNISSVCRKYEAYKVTSLKLITFPEHNDISTYHITLNTTSPAILDTYITENQSTMEYEVFAIERADGKSHFMPLSTQDEIATLLNNHTKQWGFRRHSYLKTVSYLFPVFCIVFWIIVNQTMNSEPVVIPPPSNYSIEAPRIITRDSCNLKIIDPWDPSIHEFMIDVDPTKNCDRNWTPYTELKDGIWRILKEKEGRECKARCFEMIDFTQPFNKTDWFPPGPTNCEFLEAVCWEDNKEVYGYIHTQIIPKSKKMLQEKPLNKPDVYVFLIDSLSSTAAHRSLPKTLEFLKSRFKAINFPFVSQSASRSKTNAFSLWFGKQSENAARVGGERLNVDWTEFEYCRKYLDGQPILFSEFEKEGYTTLHSEDSPNQGVNTYPSCNGFKNRYSNHSFFPFAKIHNNLSLEITKQHLKGDKLCREIHLAAMEYLIQFAEAYEDRPKFAWHWNSHLQHDNLAGANRLDGQLEKLFNDHLDKFDNSFVFLMADHGFRFGQMPIDKPDIMKLEKKNPLLYISVPKKYRDNGILEVMKENAERLQTHYDTRATFLDILKYQPSKNFNDRSFFQIPNEKGQSLIRKQPKTPRNCKTLPIPQQYCLCQSKETDMIKDIELSQRLARELINHVHRKLEALNITSVCQRYEAYNVTSLKLFEFSVPEEAFISTYHIILKTTSRAILDTYITENHLSKELEIFEIERGDYYGRTTDCSRSINWSNLCVCNE